MGSGGELGYTEIDTGEAHAAYVCGKGLGLGCGSIPVLTENLSGAGAPVLILRGKCS